jgi:hypothetical protein
VAFSLQSLNDNSVERTSLNAGAAAELGESSAPMTTTEYPTQTMVVSIHFFFLLIHEGDFTALLTKEKTA